MCRPFPPKRSDDGHQWNENPQWASTTVSVGRGALASTTNRQKMMHGSVRQFRDWLMAISGALSSLEGHRDTVGERRPREIVWKHSKMESHLTRKKAASCMRMLSTITGASILLLHQESSTKHPICHLYKGEDITPPVSLFSVPLSVLSYDRIQLAGRDCLTLFPIPHPATPTPPSAAMSEDDDGQLFEWKEIDNSDDTMLVGLDWDPLRQQFLDHLQSLPQTIQKVVTPISAATSAMCNSGWVQMAIREL